MSLFEEYLLEDISEIEFDYLLSHGMRHFGDYFFRPRCKDCHRCIPIRVRVPDFKITRSQRRALNASKEVRVKIGPPEFSMEKFDLYLEHKKRFKALVDDVEDQKNFRMSFYTQSPFGIEFEYYLGDKLIGVALGDKTKNAFSAIYTFYSKDAENMSLGTFSVIKQLNFCQDNYIRYFYLGYYIPENQSLRYKANFRPNEVYLEGVWRPFRNSKGDKLVADNKLAWINSEFLVRAAPKAE